MIIKIIYKNVYLYSHELGPGQDPARPELPAVPPPSLPLAVPMGGGLNLEGPQRITAEGWKDGSTERETQRKIPSELSTRLQRIPKDSTGFQRII